MKIPFLFSFIICVFVESVNAQNQKEQYFIDNLSLKISYNVKYYDYVSPTYPIDPEDYMEETVITEVGDRTSYSYSTREKGINENMDKLEEETGTRRVSLSLMHAQFGFYYIDFPKGSMTVIKNMQAAGLYKYSVKIPTIKWKIGKETREIAGYTCAKAEGSVYGRSWTVWFANEIPISRGPLFLCGLPGLILEASDSESHYTLVCEGIEKAEGSIVYDDRKYVETTREKARKTEAASLKHPTQFYADYGLTLKMDGESFSEMPYNPIERK